MLVSICGTPAYRITTQFGVTDAIHPKPHMGIDLAMAKGTDILAPDDGVISRVIDTGDAGLGKAVYMKVEDGKELVFGHLSDVDVKENEFIRMGHKIADSGNTGHSTGPHLHLALKDNAGHYIDPSKYVDTVNTWAIPDDPSWWQRMLDHANGFADNFIHKEAEWVVEPAVKFTGDRFMDLFALLNAHSLEIIVLGIDVCAFGVMLAPLLGVAGGKWLGRLFGVFFLGALWRLLT